MLAQHSKAPCVLSERLSWAILLRVDSERWIIRKPRTTPLTRPVFLVGAFAVIPHGVQGKMTEALPLFNGHTAGVLDTDFNPFNDHIVASASEDCKVCLGSRPVSRLHFMLTQGSLFPRP